MSEQPAWWHCEPPNEPSTEIYVCSCGVEWTFHAEYGNTWVPAPLEARYAAQVTDEVDDVS